MAEEMFFDTDGFEFFISLKKGKQQAGENRMKFSFDIAASEKT